MRKSSSRNCATQLLSFFKFYGSCSNTVWIRLSHNSSITLHFRGDLYFPGFINIKTKLRRHTLPQSCHCLPFLFSSSLCSISAFVTSSFSLLVSTEGLHSGHVEWQEEYSFSPLANEVYFHAKITSLFLPSNMVVMETLNCSPTFFLRFAAICLISCNTPVVASGLLYANNFSSILLFNMHFFYFYRENLCFFSQLRQNNSRTRFKLIRLVLSRVLVFSTCIDKHIYVTLQYDVIY